MRIFLPNKKELRGDLLPVIIQRTDLVAVPSTLELLVRVDEQLNAFIQTGQKLTLKIEDEHNPEVTQPDIEYNIIFTSTENAQTSFNQGNPNYHLTKVIAILDSCHKIAFASNKAIIKENASMSDIYRACGATVAVTDDIRIEKFTSLVGDAPSFSIMTALQREAAVLIWNGKKNSVSFKRILDLFSQKPKEILPLDITQAISSGFKERHTAPSFFSNKEDGELNKGKSKEGRSANYMMFSNQQTLNNLSTYLVYCKVWTTKWMPFLYAGDIIEIEKKPYVIVTAVHLFSQAGSGSGSQLSRFWLAESSNNIDKTK